MSWIEKLYQTYETCANNPANTGNPQDKVPLVPAYHTIQNAHIEIAIDEKGNFLRARLLDKTESPTIIPATEDSMSRTGSTPASHPLCDKLQYVAGDFLQFGGEVTSGFAKHPQKPHQTYLKLLSDWCASPFSHRKVSAVYSYVKRGSVIFDLIKDGKFSVDSSGKLPKSRPAGTKNPPQDAFIRWAVEIPGDPVSKLSSDPSVWKSWADFQISLAPMKGLCYVTGNDTIIASNHPKRIRYGGDGAKLISSNDIDGYTFRGRFINADQACQVGIDVTQKAHSALRWLIARQGHVEWVKDGERNKPALCVVAWAVSGAEIPDPLGDTYELLFGKPGNHASVTGNYTAQETGIQLSKMIAGYSTKLGSTDDVVVMAMDSATPGRMAIRYYHELTGTDFLGRILAWHDIQNGCTWRQNIEAGREFIGAPALKDIAEAAYGRRLDGKLRAATVERLLPCIIDGTPIPRDLVDSCVRHASNRASFDKTYHWEKALGIACALFKYQNKERRYSMALERDRKSRDYLYGRLLALAEHLEDRALHMADENRETNAARLMQRFANRPNSTWRTIEPLLTPYKARLRAKWPGLLITLEKEMDQVFSMFPSDGFLSDQPLSGEFLLGYHCQRAELWAKPVD